MQIGFTTGIIRKSVDVSGFRMGKFPVTVAQFRACRDAGACGEPPQGECANSDLTPLSGPTLDGKEGTLPATCVGIEAAGDYCKWQGGRLPQLAEWLLAARGTQPRHFAVGDERPSCSQHPFGRPEEKDGIVRGCGRHDELPRLLRVGTHPEGASASGVQDVLLAPGELLASEEGSPYVACALPTPGCVVHGVVPGAIESVAPVPAPGSTIGAEPDAGDGERRGRLSRAYAFRCVWGEAS